MANEFANVEYLRGFVTGMAMQPLLVTTETASAPVSEDAGLVIAMESSVYFGVASNVIKVTPQE